MEHNEIVNKIGGLLNLNMKEREALQKSRPARIITALPGLAGSKYPEREALKNLLCMAQAHKDMAFDSIPGEGLGERMFDISDIQGGDQAVVDYGMGLLELGSLEDHKKDIEADLKEGKYNPIQAGGIDYEKAKIGIIDRLKKLWETASEKAKEAFSILDALESDEEGNWL